MYKKLLLSSLFFILFIPLLIFPINNVNAYGKYTITLPSNPIFSEGTFRSMHLSNDKYAYVIAQQGTTNNLHVWLFSSSGTLLAYNFVTIPLISGTIVKCALSLYDNGTNLIIMGLQHTGGAQSPILFAFSLNTITYAFTQYNYVTTYACTLDNLYISNIVVYNDAFYAIISYNGTEASRTYYGKLTYTGTLSIIQISATNNFVGSIFITQNEDTPENIYIVSGKPNDETRPIYYKGDLSAQTASYLCEHPTNNHWRIDTYLSLRFLGGGLYTQEDGKYILYFTWSWCDNYGDLEIIQHRLKFSSSGVDAGNLEAQNQRNGIFGQSSNVAEQEISLAGGYLENYYTIKLWRIRQTEPYSGIFYCIRSTLNSSQWENFDITYLDLESPDNNEDASVIYEDAYWRITRISTSTMQTSEDNNNQYVYIYSGLQEGQRTYTLSISYLPSGDLYTHTQYSWIITLTVNGQVRKDYQIVMKIDDQVLGTKTTDINGKVNFLVYLTISGFHRFYYYVYFSNAMEYDIYDDYIVISLDAEDDTSIITTQLLYSLTIMIPLLFVVLLPAFILFIIMKDVIGFLIGLVIGGFLGYSVGLISLSTIFLIGLLVITYIVIIWKKG